MTHARGSVCQKEAKDLADSAPSAVRKGIDRDEADLLKKQLKEAGALVELRPT